MAKKAASAKKKSKASPRKKSSTVRKKTKKATKKKITWKLKEGATWRRKLEANHESHGKLVAIPPRMQKNLGTGTMLIPRPLDVDAAMRKVRKGKLLAASELRRFLAAQAGSNSTCPLTTGIFMRIAAEAAEEDRASGKKRITPYWRTIRDDGKLNEKYPGGAKAQAARLREEGFELEPGKGKQPPKIVGFEDALLSLK